MPFGLVVGRAGTLVLFSGNFPCILSATGLSSTH